MKVNKPILAGLVLGLLGIGIIWLEPIPSPIVSYAIKAENVGPITIAKPWWGLQGVALVFVDSQKFSAGNLTQKLTNIGVATAVVDVAEFFGSYNSTSSKCLSEQAVSESISTILRVLPTPEDKPLFISGIADGALVPFINAHSETKANVAKISIGFSVDLPTGLKLCSPFITEEKNQKRRLVSAPKVNKEWRSVWVDKPAGDTAIFIKEKADRADTYIAAYNTPLDSLLITELQSKLGQGNDEPPMPIIEIPAANNKETVTLFYSGDGGWRDLDRSVADEMAALGQSVVGVDVLRYFWERRTPDQVASDLAATMRYYRTKWGVKSFILAGFSFGADILPVVYNRLTAADKDNVKRLVFLALGKHADFEVHVAGWLGQTTHEMPLTSELEQIPNNKMLCIYGKDEKAKTGTACSSLENTEATVLELPGGHHFDKDYPKLARLILDDLKQHGIY